MLSKWAHIYDQGEASLIHANPKGWRRLYQGAKLIV